MPFRPVVLLDCLESRCHFDVIPAGQTLTTAITAARPIKNFQVNLTAGQAIYVAAGEATASAFQTQIVLTAPNGKTVGRSIGESGAFLGKTAPITGTYNIRVRDTTGTHRSSVNLTTFYTGNSTVTDSDDAGLGASGRRFAATISPGDLDVWRIDVDEPNAYLGVVANENDAGSDVGIGVALIGPDGRGIKGAESDSGVVIDDPDAGPGTYYAVAFEPGANATGRYGLSFGRAPGVQSTEDADTLQPLVAGTTRNGDMPSGDTDVFSTALGKRVSVTITLTRTSDTATPELLLIDPDGHVVAEANGTTTATLKYTTPATRGTYSVVTRNRDTSTGGQYRISLTAS